MTQAPTATITDHFASLIDPRVDRTRRHLLSDILTIAICAVISGADSFTEMEQFGEDKESWFKTFLPLPHGIPSHDTFGRLFAALDPKAFGACFTSWVSAIVEATDGKVVAIDGKTLRRSIDRASGKSGIHMVSAWMDVNGLVWGQAKTDEKSNEITAIPKLLEMLELNGCIVTIDAMGCQKKIAEKIIDREADYVLALKGNQAIMEEEVKLFFDGAQKSDWKDIPCAFHETIDKGHGRIEIRKYFVTSDIEWFVDRADWKGLKSFGMVLSERYVGGEVCKERRFYISSLSGTDSKIYPIFFTLCSC